MKRIAVILPFLLLCLSCQAQPKPQPLLLKFQEITALRDSLSHTRLVIGPGSDRKWAPAFQFIDSIAVRHITYLSDGLKVNGYLVLPKKEGKHPCIIWNRGGVKDFGEITLIQAAAMMGKLAARGYTVIGTQYRGNGGSEGREEYGGAEISDVLNLIPLLAEMPKADTAKIGMFGGSRGGTMTYIALTKTNKIKTAAVLGAPADARASIADRPSLENSLLELVDGYEQNKDAELDKRSAMKWVDKFPKNVPLFIMHGGSDWRVKPEQSLRLALELDKLRVPYRLKIYEGGDHGLSEFREEFYNDLTAWFDAYLKNDTPLPNMVFHGS